MGAECPLPSHGAVASTFFFLFFFKDKSCNLSKIVSVLRSASVERFFVSRMRDFFLMASLRLIASYLSCNVYMWLTNCFDFLFKIPYQNITNIMVMVIRIFIKSVLMLGRMTGPVCSSLCFRLLAQDNHWKNKDRVKSELFCTVYWELFR